MNSDVLAGSSPAADSNISMAEQKLLLLFYPLSSLKNVEVIKSVVAVSYFGKFPQWNVVQLHNTHSVYYFLIE